jgi:hypothetical protein
MFYPTKTNESIEDAADKAGFLLNSWRYAGARLPCFPERIHLNSVGERLYFAEAD